jgi:hypothetical protein
MKLGFKDLSTEIDLRTEIPSEKSIKLARRTALYVVHFIVMLPIYLIAFFGLMSAHDPTSASVFLIVMILHIDLLLVPALIEPIINYRILFYVVHFIVMLPIYLIMFFVLISIDNPMSASLPLIVMILHLGIRVVGAIQKFLEPFFFIEKSFKVYEHTKEAKFFLKNNRCYLAFLHENSIEIYDVQKGNIVIQEEGNLKLFNPYNTFILTYSSIVENRSRRYIIKLYDINTYKSVFSCILDDKGKLFFSKNRKYLLCCNTTTEEGHEYDEGYWSWTDYYYDLKIWEIKTGLVIYDKKLSVDIKRYSSAASDQEIKTAINKVLKSYKEVGELDELDEQENTPPLYPISIIFPSCKQNYNGYMEYDMKKIRQDKFTEKAIYIKVKIPLKELR